MREGRQEIALKLDDVVSASTEDTAAPVFCSLQTGDFVTFEIEEEQKDPPGGL